MQGQGKTLASIIVAAAAVLGFAASAQAATIPVTNTNDDGSGSLRAAIEAANVAANPDVVDATGLSGAINLQTGLPTIPEDVEIRGPGASTLTVRRAPGVATQVRIFRFLSATAEISGVTIANGRIEDPTLGGAGILNQQGTLTLRESVVAGNVNAGSSSGANGGGISNTGPSAANPATLTIVDSTVSGNTTTAGYGAAIHNNGFGTVTVVRSTLSGNVAQGGEGCVGGGAIHSSGTLSVVNSTVSGNTAPPNGVVGGIYSCTTVGGSNTIRNSTIAANRASPGAPVNVGIALQGAVTNAITLKSTIVARPLGGGPNCLVNAPATLTSQGYNLGSDASCNLNATADQPSTNPMLGPLANNGGLTRTMAPLSGGPAIDRGIGGGLTTDQRGLTRPVDFPTIPNAPGGDGSDIGAFELQLPEPPEPSNEFSFGKVKKNKRKGTAKLTVIVPGPGELDLVKTKKVKPDDEVADAEGEEKLKVKPKRKSKRKLRKKGKAKVKAEVTYTPTGGEPNTKSKKLKLKKRR
jgi:hypothetical protein